MPPSSTAMPSDEVAAAASRVFVRADPFAARDAGRDWNQRGVWPAKWICCPNAGPPPFVSAYRCRFTLDAPATIRAHVSADERYELFVDGARVGRGPERGDADHWFFETYDLDLAAGAHVFVARVWSLGFDDAPYAQMSVAPGFLLCPEGDEHLALVGTGTAAWEAKTLPGYTFTPMLAAWGCGANLEVDGSRFAWNWETGAGDDWQPAQVARPAVNDRKNDLSPNNLLTPAVLPPMLDTPRRAGTVRLVAETASLATAPVPIRAADNRADEQAAWQRLVEGQEGLTVPPHSRHRVLLDLDDYVCAYPEVVTSGGGPGSRVRVHWQESLFNEPDTKTKGNRDAIEGKFFTTIWHKRDGIGDAFLPPGGNEQRRFDTLWWQCGRYVEIVVETGEKPLTIHELTLRETRYPLENESRFEASDERLARDIAPLAVRALQMCSHETYMDCPYFEQLMYIGDTRLESLVTYTITRDDRLPRKALSLFDASRMPSGLTQSRYPTKVRQIIPPFSLWYVGMVHDYHLWRGDPAFVRALLPGVRGIVDHFLALRNADGLLGPPNGWNYVDWVPAWKSGIPPGGLDGPSAPLCFQTALVLGLLADLENTAGERELAARARRAQREITEASAAAFWNEGRGLFADDPGHTSFSEHAQCLALLGGQVGGEQRERVAAGLLTDPDLARTTIMFSHYLFETYRLLGRADALFERLNLWFDLKANGLKTTVEMPEPTRSDCHAWGAHPMYHFFATLLGIRPAAPGFAQVEIRPLLGPLTHASGTLPHPNGEITVKVRREGGGDTLRADIALPNGVTGTFGAGEETVALRPGSQTVSIADRG